MQNIISLEQDNYYHIYNCGINGENLFRDEENYEYIQTVVVYNHNNPVHHGFVNHAADWPWSSYVSCISSEPTKLKRNEVIEIFDDVYKFKYVHQQKIELIEIERFLEING